RSVELCLAIRSAEFRPTIETNCQLGFRNLSGLGEAHSVYARYKPGASHSRKGNLRGRWHAWRFHTHRPRHAIQPGAFACWHFIDHAPRGIQDFQLQFSKQMTLTLIIIDHSSVRRIIANENGVAIGPSA